MSDALRVASALAIGLLLGLERERSHARDDRQVAGSRTFALLALGGALAAYFNTWVIAGGFVAVGAMLAVGYWRTSESDAGSTTEMAALIAYLLGALAWTDTALAAGVAIVVVALLSAKQQIHTFAREVITPTEVEDAIKFLVMAFVALPLLPNRDLGPYGVLNPAHIWRLVVVLTGISWAGYIATRLLGQKRGLFIAGLAGGFISATATTAAMARTARDSAQFRAALAGAYIASVSTFAQLAAITYVANSELLARLWPALAVGALAMIAVAATGLLRRGSSGQAVEQEAEPEAVEPVVVQEADPESQAPFSRPFALKAVVILAGVLTAALLFGRWLVAVIGPEATILASGATGIADAHAGALSAVTLHEQSQISTSAALVAVGAALCANAVTKIVVAFTAGGSRFGWRFCAGVVPAFAVFGGTIAFLAAA